MALENIHLRKLLTLMFSDDAQRRSALRGDIRDDLKREAGESGGGGDFYSPFWADAKSHVFGGGDLRLMTAERIAANESRANLYPKLRDGFLNWWEEKRRWTNQPFRPGRNLKARVSIFGPGVTVKVENILTVVDAIGDEHVVYSYFSPKPALTDEAAKIGLWLMSCALPGTPVDELRILDIIRGRTFSIDRTPLTGEEEFEFRARFARLIRERDDLRKEYC